MRYENGPAPPPPARTSATRLPQDPPESKPTDGGPYEDRRPSQFLGCETAPLRHDRGSAGRLVRCLRRWPDSRRGDLSHRADLCDVARRVGGGVYPGQLLTISRWPRSATR